MPVGRAGNRGREQLQLRCIHSGSGLGQESWSQLTIRQGYNSGIYDDMSWNMTHGVIVEAQIMYGTQ